MFNSVHAYQHVKYTLFEGVALVCCGVRGHLGHIHRVLLYMDDPKGIRATFGGFARVGMRTQFASAPKRLFLPFPPTSGTDCIAASCIWHLYSANPNAVLFWALKRRHGYPKDSPCHINHVHIVVICCACAVVRETIYAIY